MINSSTNPDKSYRFVQYKEVYIKTNLTGRSCNFEWIEIKDDGTIIIKCSENKGYAWDGCSPKFIFIDLVFGTPDGRMDYNTEKPITYYASLFHDALYQYKSEVTLSRKEVDILFKLILKNSKFKLSTIYYYSVRLFGNLYGNWAVKKSTKKIKIDSYSWLNV